MKLASVIASLALSVSAVSASGAVELTLDNFASETNGKNAFVKFLAPCTFHEDTQRLWVILL